MNFQITREITEDAKILARLLDDKKQQLNEWVVDTLDSTVREALIALGWKPPRAASSKPGKRMGRINAASLENSPRLQRVLTFLRGMGPRGATTMEIVNGARVAVASTAVSELRANGIGVECKMESEGDDGTRIYRYTLAEFV